MTNPPTPIRQSQFGECRFLGMLLFSHFLVFSEPSIEIFLFGLPIVEFVANYLCTEWLMPGSKLTTNWSHMQLDFWLCN